MTTESARLVPLERHATVPVPSLPLDFQMGEWRVQPSLGRLGRHGVEIRLRPQLMDVLYCLAMRAGQTVGRREIFSTVWPGQFVAETGLPRCIAELRQVFHDDARDPTVIETIPKRGYRLLPPVAWSQDGDKLVQVARGSVHSIRTDLRARECPTITAHAAEAANPSMLGPVVGEADSGDRGLRAEVAWGKGGDPHTGAAAGTGDCGTGAYVRGRAARFAGGWRWRGITGWLTGVAVAIRSFVR